MNWTRERVQRGLRNRLNRYIRLPLGRWRLRRALDRTAPVIVNDDGPVEVHMLCNHDRLHDGIASLKSFYRRVPAAFPLVIHDDGSFATESEGLLKRHFPGVRVIWRRDADAQVNPALREAGMERCLELRARFFMSLKLFDIPYFADGKRVLLLDSDVLFFSEPKAVLDALAAPEAAWTERFNADVSDGWYAFSEADVLAETGIAIVPRYNAGLVCMRRSPGCWNLYERCLGLTPLPHRGWWLEQTLNAIESSRQGASALPEEYDVAGRHSSTGEPVVSEHYCGELRTRFYSDFCKVVANQLR